MLKQAAWDRPSRKLAPWLGVSALATLLAGCGNFVASTGVYYNSGMADASNSVLLTNIVRAAKGYPVYYSAIGDYSASRSVDASLGVNVDASSKSGPGSALEVGDVGVNIGPSFNMDRNANATNLGLRPHPRNA